VPGTPVRVDVNGSTATADQLRDYVLGPYGHFTAMQVRSARTRGLALHLARLEAATRELFGRGLDGDQVRAHIRHALGDIQDASVRVIVYWPAADPDPAIMVTVRPPAQLAADRQRLMPVPYQRPVPHIKHTGDVGQAYYGRAAVREGFDDALLTGPDGTIAEGAITNIAFSDGSVLTWPDAPCLAGITWQLVEPRLASSGLPTRRAPVRLADLPSQRAAIVTNSHGVGPVGWIGPVELPGSAALARAVGEIYASVPWDPI
jgi:branched-subunit amino acid aminotransferase/4-amino-4-deoxychorismate lyase